MNTSRFAGLTAAGIVAAALFASPGLKAGAAAQHTAVAVTPTYVNMVIVPGIRLGPDKKMHDAFTPTDLTAFVGQKVVLTIYNYDMGSHSFTAPGLHLNFIIPASARNGVPVIKTFTFTVNKAGSYQWWCALPCDSDAKGWAMTHDHYMAGTVTIVKR